MPQFPEDDALGRAFFEESIRHLEDARVLHEAGRYPAAITSAMKAAELAIKCVVVLGGALGWWDKIFSTHSPLSAISDSRTFPYFQYHIVALGQKDKTLVAEIKKMEKLAPLSPSGPYSLDDQQNPEYPFLSYQTASEGVPAELRLNKPSTHFTQFDSRKYYSTAQDLLTAVAAQYATVGGWGLAVPPAL